MTIATVFGRSRAYRLFLRNKPTLCAAHRQVAVIINCGAMVESLRIDAITNGDASWDDPRSLAPLRDRTAILSTVGGAFTGPFLGVSFLLVALYAAPVGVASTLMALTPVLLLPISRFVFKERITLRAAIGTALAVGGVAILFLVRAL